VLVDEARQFTLFICAIRTALDELTNRLQSSSSALVLELAAPCGIRRDFD